MCRLALKNIFITCITQKTKLGLLDWIKINILVHKNSCQRFINLIEIAAATDQTQIYD